MALEPDATDAVGDAPVMSLAEALALARALQGFRRRGYVSLPILHSLLESYVSTEDEGYARCAGAMLLELDPAVRRDLMGRLGQVMQP